MRQKYSIKEHLPRIQSLSLRVSKPIYAMALYAAFCLNFLASNTAQAHVSQNPPSNCAAYLGGMMPATPSSMVAPQKPDSVEMVWVEVLPGTFVPDAFECEHCGNPESPPMNPVDSRYYYKTDSSGKPIPAATCSGCGSGMDIMNELGNIRLNRVPPKLYIIKNFRFPSGLVATRAFMQLPRHVVMEALKPGGIAYGPESELYRVYAQGIIAQCDTCGTNYGVTEIGFEGFNCINCGDKIRPEKKEDGGSVVYDLEEPWWPPRVARDPLGNQYRPDDLAEGEGPWSLPQWEGPPQLISIVVGDLPPGGQYVNPKVERAYRAGSPSISTSSRVATRSSSTASNRPSATPSNNRGQSRRNSRIGKIGILSLIAAGAAAGVGYFIQNDTVVAIGEVIAVDNQNRALIEYKEMQDALNPNSPSYRVVLNTEELTALPGTEAEPLEAGDPVEIKYTWVDHHYLSFIFNSGYQSVEVLLDGSFASGESMERDQ